MMTTRLHSSATATAKEDAPRLGLAARVSHLRGGASSAAMVRQAVERTEKVSSARLDVPVLDADGNLVRPTIRLVWDERTRLIRGWTVELPNAAAA